MMNDRLLFAGLCSFVLGLLLTPIIRRIARKRALLDRPNDRSSHAVPVPRVGGFAIVLGTVIGALVAVHYIDWRLSLLGLASILLALTGLYDDVVSLSPMQKYVPQLIAAILASVALTPEFILRSPLGTYHIDGIDASIISAVWIMTFINVFNFMDGVDGLAAGSGALIAFGVLMLTSGAGAFMLLPLAGALLGFLCWNSDPASIFMGDVGSQFVGYVLAIGVLHWPDQSVDILAVGIIFAPLLFDTGVTLVRRLFNGENILRAHRTHLYQRLARLGYSHRAIANLYYLFCASSLLVTVGYLRGTSLQRVIAILALMMLLVSYAFVVTLLEKGIVASDWLAPSTFADTDDERSNAESKTRTWNPIHTKERSK